MGKRSFESSRMPAPETEHDAFVGLEVTMSALTILVAETALVVAPIVVAVSVAVEVIAVRVLVVTFSSSLAPAVLQSSKVFMLQ